MSNLLKPENSNAEKLLSMSDVADLFGLQVAVVRQRLAGTRSRQEYFSIAELALRWRCSRGTVYNRLRSIGAKVLDFAPPGKRGKKVVPLRVVTQIEESKMKHFR